MKKILVTGSSGLIGPEVCSYFAGQGWLIRGVDNNQRAVFFKKILSESSQVDRGMRLS